MWWGQRWQCVKWKDQRAGSDRQHAVRDENAAEELGSTNKSALPMDNCQAHTHSHSQIKPDH